MLHSRMKIVMIAGLTVAAYMALGADVAHAGTAQSLPWEGPLKKIQDSITGPVALVLSLVGIVVAGGTLIFGGELNDFSRRAIILALVISLIALAANFLSTLFGTVGAVIPGAM